MIPDEENERRTEAVKNDDDEQDYEYFDGHCSLGCW
jgi:hypothetical protein